ncbi:MAG: UMP kinase [Candidatus Woesearchaeota archaeon]
MKKEKKVIVLSLGGSLIIPDKVNSTYLKKLKQILLKNKKKYKFIIVCGGGSLARKYIKAIQSQRGEQKFQALAGISATRTNARFMNYFFEIDPERGIPKTKDAIRKYLDELDIIFCGALKYKPNQTSDSTASQIAREFNTSFVNLTNVDGLYDKNPNKHKDAKLIKEISWEEFNKKATSMKFKPGQHFVLDQKASEIIMKNKIPTYIIGKNIKEFDNFLNNRKFKGTIIKD